MKNKYYVLICDGEVKIINVPQNINLYFVLKEFNASRAVACESLKQAKIIKNKFTNGDYSEECSRIPFYTEMFLQFIENIGFNLIKGKYGYGLKEHKKPKWEFHYKGYNDICDLIAVAFCSVSEMLDYINDTIEFRSDNNLSDSILPYKYNSILKTLIKHGDEIFFNDCYCEIYSD